MHKDELIQMHTLLCEIKTHLEQHGVTGPEAFLEYREMGVSPIHVHRSKSEHKRAIFTLGKELADIISDGEYSGPARISHRMETILSKMERVRIH